MSRTVVLFIVGIMIITVEIVNAEILGRTFHFEFLILGASFCGVSITQWGDKR